MKNNVINLCDSIINRCETIQKSGQALLDLLDKMIAEEKAELEKLKQEK